MRRTMILFLVAALLGPAILTQPASSTSRTGSWEEQLKSMGFFIMHLSASKLSDEKQQFTAALFLLLPGNVEVYDRLIERLEERSKSGDTRPHRSAIESQGSTRRQTSMWMQQSRNAPGQ